MSALPATIAGHPADLVCTFRCPKCSATVTMIYEATVAGGHRHLDRADHVDRLGNVVQTGCSFTSWHEFCGCPTTNRQ